MATRNLYSKYTRPMTKIEKQVRDTLCEEFEGKLGYEGHSGWKLTGHDLYNTMEHVIYGITVKAWDSKKTYQEWQDCPVGPMNFRKIYKRAQELLRFRLEDIYKAQWFAIRFTSMDGLRDTHYVNADTIGEAQGKMKSLAMWGNKPTSLWYANWDGRKFTQGKRIQ